jgi:hypothetical protein
VRSITHVIIKILSFNVTFHWKGSGRSLQSQLLTFQREGDGRSVGSSDYSNVMSKLQSQLLTFLKVVQNGVSVDKGKQVFCLRISLKKHLKNNMKILLSKGYSLKLC